MRTQTESRKQRAVSREEHKQLEFQLFKPVSWRQMDELLRLLWMERVPRFKAPFVLNRLCLSVYGKFLFELDAMQAEQLFQVVFKNPQALQGKRW